jgi:hypothetical protein
MIRTLEAAYLSETKNVRKTLCLNPYGNRLIGRQYEGEILLDRYYTTGIRVHELNYTAQVLCEMASVRYSFIKTKEEDMRVAYSMYSRNNNS